MMDLECRFIFQKKRSSDKGVTVSSFSRNLEQTTHMFPELLDVGKQIKATQAILDSEAVGIDKKTGSIVPFQLMITRKRKHDIEKMKQKVPLVFYVYDVLFVDGKNLLNKPLSYRRNVLKKIVVGSNILRIAPQIVTSNSQEIMKYHKEQLDKGLEGVIVKKWDGIYKPGRREYTWVKFKEAEGKVGQLTDTIDAVIMGYSYGKGKRAAFGMGQFIVGVKNGSSFVTLTKIGTGISDKQLESISKKLQKYKVNKKPAVYDVVHKTLVPDEWVTPNIVVEIAGDNVTKSVTHGAGYAVRFPRLVKVRQDKSAQDVTTVDEIKTMYNQQKIK